MDPNFKLDPEEIFATLADLVSINSVNAENSVGTTHRPDFRIAS